MQANRKKKPQPRDSWGKSFLNPILDSKTFSTAACSAGIWIAEIEAFSIKTIRKIQGCIDQVKEAFEVRDYFYSIVFENLIHGLLLIVKVQLITQPRTAATDH